MQNICAKKIVFIDMCKKKHISCVCFLIVFKKFLLEKAGKLREEKIRYHILLYDGHAKDGFKEWIGTAFS